MIIGDYKVAELLRTWHLGDESKGLPPLKLLDRNLDFDWKTTRVKKDGSTVEVEDKANYSKAKLVSYIGIIHDTYSVKLLPSWLDSGCKQVLDLIVDQGRRMGLITRQNPLKSYNNAPL